MRYLGIVTAIVVTVCVFTFVTRYSTSEFPSANSKSSRDYGATVNSVRETVRKVTSEEERGKWAIALQMKMTGTPDEASYGVEGANSEVLVIRSDSMDLSRCSNFAMSENGVAAAGVGFTSVSCRTSSNGVVLERILSSEK